MNGCRNLEKLPPAAWLAAVGNQGVRPRAGGVGGSVLIFGSFGMMG